MNTRLRAHDRLDLPLACVFWVLLGLATRCIAAEPSVPSILSVRNTRQSVLVTVSMPQGWHVLVLESCSNAAAGGWIPRAATHGRRAGRVTFKLPAALKGQQFRVEGQLLPPVPEKFYHGRRAFAGRRSLTWRPDQGQGQAFTLEADGNLPGAVSVPSTANSARAVTDSDIWQINGNTLYLFNQLRGLQIIDISNPDAPSFQGRLELPAAGEQMFLLDPEHVALLAYDNCSGDGNSELLIVDVSGPTPQTVADLPVAGWVEESRLVGSALYVAAAGYSPASATNTASADWGTIVQSFDLGNPAAPISRSTLFFPGDENAVLSNDHWLFVATQDYSTPDSEQVIEVIYISAANGALGAATRIATAGQVTDKSGMSVLGDNVLAVVSEAYDASTNDLANGSWQTTIQTFSLAMGAISPVGRLDLASGDELFGTSFDSNRVYVSTYLETDPLWVVDLSDPAQPAAAGSVQVPGYSTVIRPLGSRLLTVGTQTNRVAVSLFDVSNPAQPALLSTVLLGNNFSWSDISEDDKALAVLPDLGLALVPYEGETTNGWTSQVQLIDLGTNSLTLRGLLEHAFQPLRSTNYEGRIISVSDQACLSVNISNRDAPVVTADLELGWPVNRLFLQGSYLLELDTGGGWFDPSGPALRVASTIQPDEVTNELNLGNLPIAGATLRDGRLYLLQTPEIFYPIFAGPIALTQPAGFVPEPDSATNLVLTVIDVSALPSLAVLSETILPLGSLPAGGNYQALWPATNLLVWFSTGFGFWINPLVDAPVSGPVPASGVLPVATGAVTPIGLTNFGAVPPLVNSASRPASGERTKAVRPFSQSRQVKGHAARDARLTAVKGHGSTSASGAAASAQPFLQIPYWWPWWNSGGAQILAFDVSEPTKVQMVSTLNVNPTNSWGFSPPQTAQGLVYFSHEQSVTQPGGEWMASAWLDVVDFSTATNPAVRPPVNIPGQLAGVSSNGALLYLLANSPSASVSGALPQSALDACAYDGVSAYLVASLPLPVTWPCPVIVSGDVVYLGRANADTNRASTLESWSLSPQGQFQKLASLHVPQPLSALAAFGTLIAAEDRNSGISLFDASTPSLLLPDGNGVSPNCLWFDLNFAAGASTTGLWIPLDDYGTASVPVSGH